MTTLKPRYENPGGGVFLGAVSDSTYDYDIWYREGEDNDVVMIHMLAGQPLRLGFSPQRLGFSSSFLERYRDRENSSEYGWVSEILVMIDDYRDPDPSVSPNARKAS